jgi:hypothetical protein
MYSWLDLDQYILSALEIFRKAQFFAEKQAFQCLVFRDDPAKQGEI